MTEPTKAEIEARSPQVLFKAVDHAHAEAEMSVHPEGTAFLWTMGGGKAVGVALSQSDVDRLRQALAVPQAIDEMSDRLLAMFGLSEAHLEALEERMPGQHGKDWWLEMGRNDVIRQLLGKDSYDDEQEAMKDA